MGKLTAAQYVANLTRSLEESGFQLTRTHQGYLRASKQVWPIVGGQYQFVIARADGAKQTPQTLTEFIDSVFETCYAEFKKEFQVSRLLFKDLILMPVLVSDTHFSQAAIDKVLGHRNRDCIVYEFPTLVEVEPFKLYHLTWPNQVLGAGTYSDICEVIDSTLSKGIEGLLVIK